MLNRKTIGTTGLLALLTGGVLAEPITSGFESPQYALGSTLTGQNGWTPLSSGVAAGLIQNTDVRSGSQAVTLSRTATHPATYGASCLTPDFSQALRTRS